MMKPLFNGGNRAVDSKARNSDHGIDGAMPSTKIAIFIVAAISVAAFGRGAVASSGGLAAAFPIADADAVFGDWTNAALKFLAAALLILSIVVAWKKIFALDPPVSSELLRKLDRLEFEKKMADHDRRFTRIEQSLELHVAAVDKYLHDFRHEVKNDLSVVRLSGDARKNEMMDAIKDVSDAAGVRQLELAKAIGETDRHNEARVHAVWKKIDDLIMLLGEVRGKQQERNP